MLVQVSLRLTIPPQRSAHTTVSLKTQASPVVKNFCQTIQLLAAFRVSQTTQANQSSTHHCSLDLRIAFNTVHCTFQVSISNPLLKRFLHETYSFWSWSFDCEITTYAQTRRPALATRNEPFLKTGSIPQIYQNSYHATQNRDAPPLAARWTKQRYFRNRWILMSYKHVLRTGRKIFENTQLLGIEGNLSRHESIILYTV